MSAPGVLLTTLSIRTSASGRQYLSGYLGKCRVVAFTGEPDRFGNETWDIFLAEPDRRSDSEHHAANGNRSSPPEAGGQRRSGSRIYAARPSRQAQLNAAADDAIARYGAPEQFDDSIPF